ncbi:MAG: MarR family transcriptional regulator [Candidatus Omnitrophota bacterium]
MAVREKDNFGSEVAKILPLILREVSKKQMTLFSKGTLSVPHVVILDLLKEKTSCKMGELAKMLSLTMSAVTGLVDKMVGLGLVKRERSRADRRVVRVSILKKGKQTVNRVEEMRRNMSDELFSVFTPGEKKEYLRLLKKVYRGIKR